MNGLARRSLAAAVLLAGIALPLLSSAPAAAVDEGVLVSSDGISFAPQAGGIFDGIGTLVPGDSAVASVWVKNGGSTPAALRISVRDLATSSDEYARNVSLSVLDPITRSSTTTPLAGLTDCAVILRAEQVAVGAVLKIDLAVGLADLTDRVAQDSTASVDFVVAMRDAAAGGFPQSACADVGAEVSTAPSAIRGYDSIASTGAGDPTALIVGGGLAIGLGLFIIVLRRRRGTPHDRALDAP